MVQESSGSTDRERQINEIISAYLEAVDAGQMPDRQEWLRRYPEFAAELEAFLADYEHVERLAQPLRPATAPLAPLPLEKVASGEAATMDSGQPTRLPVGSIIRYLGDYELLTEIARGAMGVIYKARQVSLNRVVAVKMILAGQLATKADRDRFHFEAQAAAVLDHPNIVPVFEVGEFEGQHYFSMGYVDGQSLATRLAEGPLPPKEAAELVATVAEAVEYAHRQGVIHRDIKPSNILIDSKGRVRVTDFGLAKQVGNGSDVTATGQILGTPCYMPPEQAAGQIKAVGPAADVYALGALLYATLAGRPPFQAATPLETLQQVLDREPVALRQLNAAVPRDLETIVLKCLEKPILRRYATAQGLADDLRRYLEGRPILARPVPRWERAWRWCRRQPVVAELAAAVAVTLVAGTVISSIFAVKASMEKDRANDNAKQAATEKDRANESAKRADQKAEEAYRNATEAQRKTKEAKDEREKAEQNQYRISIALAQQKWLSDDVAGVEAILDACPVRFRHWEWGYLKRLCHLDLLTLREPNVGIHFVCFSSDGKRVATASLAGTARVWDAASGQHLLTLRGHTDAVLSMCFSPNDKRLATASVDNTAKIWDPASGQELLTLRGHTARVESVCFSADGKRLATASSDETAKIWDTTSGEDLLTLRIPRERVYSVCFSPDGKRLATGGIGEAARIWDASNGREVLVLHGHMGSLSHVCFSPDGKRLATTTGGSAVKVWDAQNGQEVLALRGHTMLVNSVCFSADGERIATGSHDHTAKIWDATNGNVLLTLSHEEMVDSVCFSADGRRLATTSRGSAKIWDAVTSREALTLREHVGYYGRACFSPSGRLLATACGDGTIKVWDVASAEELLTLRVPAQRVTAVCFSPDGKRLAAATYDGIAEIRDAVNGERLLTLRADWASEKALSDTAAAEGKALPAVRARGARLWCACLSPDGKRLATGQDGAVQISDAVSGKKLLILRLPASRVNSVCFSPDGRWLATGSICFNRDDGASCTGATIWDATSGEKLLTLRHTNWVNCVCFSPDGKWLATACSDRVARLWDATSGQEVFAMRGHTSNVECVSFSPDGKRLVTASADMTAKIWDLASGQELLTLSGHTNWLRYACFSPDGKRLATAEMGGAVKIWEAASWADSSPK